ncbi:hypothetical protein ASPCAL05673 [Aspergillus calidoustus]|uniref:Uncharacterized protein n=1 Tax=Aspergillus calidoustus TaxID=454130 RepID=A0A0U5FY85_ASPCI|nr:hypothetical protein ASPCAL05673 [Aspergillus calidoustus]
MWELALELRVRKYSEALQPLRTSYQHLEQGLGADNDTTKMVKPDLEISEKGVFAIWVHLSDFAGMNSVCAYVAKQAIVVSHIPSHYHEQINDGQMIHRQRQYTISFGVYFGRSCSLSRRLTTSSVAQKHQKKASSHSFPGDSQTVNHLSQHRLRIPPHPLPKSLNLPEPLLRLLFNLAPKPSEKLPIDSGIPILIQDIKLRIRLSSLHPLPHPPHDMHLNQSPERHHIQHLHHKDLRLRRVHGIEALVLKGLKVLALDRPEDLHGTEIQGFVVVGLEVLFYLHSVVVRDVRLSRAAEGTVPCARGRPGWVRAQD